MQYMPIDKCQFVEQIRCSCEFSNEDRINTINHCTQKVQRQIKFFHIIPGSFIQKGGTRYTSFKYYSTLYIDGGLWSGVSFI